MRRCLASTAALLFSSQLALAQWVDGNKLYEECKQKSSFCFGFLEALADMINKEAGIVRDEDKACFPAQTQAGQFYDLALKELAENPQLRTWPAAYIILTAMHKGWPCPKQGPGAGALFQRKAMLSGGLCSLDPATPA
jgi:Rap1a immunity proteins